MSLHFSNLHSKPKIDFARANIHLWHHQHAALWITGLGCYYIRSHSSQIRIQWGSLNSHSVVQASCPDTRGIPEKNLLIRFVTGTTHTTIKDWTELLHLPVPKETQFDATQSTYVIPTIQQAYAEPHERIMEHLIELSTSRQKIELCWDARCDNPGKAEFYYIASHCNIPV